MDRFGLVVTRWPRSTSRATSDLVIIIIIIIFFFMTYIIIIIIIIKNECHSNIN